MSLLQKNRYKLQSGLVTIIIVSCIFYFLYHVISGNRGLLALIETREQNEKKQAQLTKLVKQKKELEKKVGLLSNSSLDLDMLDEQIRANLGYALTNERVYLLENGKR